MVKVKGVYPAGIEDVYNMEVDNHHNYCVNGGYILHNCDSLRAFAASRLYSSNEPKPRTYEWEEEDNEDSYFGGSVTESYLNGGY